MVTLPAQTGETEFLQNRRLCDATILRIIILLTIVFVVIMTLILPVSAGSGTVTIHAASDPKSTFTLGEKIIFTGTNTDSNTTYLSLGGQHMRATGSQIQSSDPRTTGVVDGDASTFLAIPVEPDGKWTWTWDTHNLVEPGTYVVTVLSTPRDNQHVDNSVKFSGWSGIFVLPAGASISAAASTEYLLSANLGTSMMDTDYSENVCDTFGGGKRPDFTNRTTKGVYVDWETDLEKSRLAVCPGFETGISASKFIRIHADQVRGIVPITIKVYKAEGGNEKTLVAVKTASGTEAVDLYLDLTQPLPALTDTPPSSPIRTTVPGTSPLATVTLTSTAPSIPSGTSVTPIIKSSAKPLPTSWPNDSPEKAPVDPALILTAIGVAGIALRRA
jgi:hypothetical protein